MNKERQNTSNRVSRRAVVSAALGASVLTACARSAPHSVLTDLKRPNSKKPNILFIAIDDLRPELGVYGSSIAKTPNLDALAAQGLVFENAYVQQAVCAPSRINLMTGLRPDSSGVRDIYTPLPSTAPDVETINGLFGRNGYKTYSFGKVYHHRDKDNSEWTRPNQDVTQEMRQSGELKRPPDRPAWEAKDVDDGHYADGRNLNAALTQLKQAALDPDPFLFFMGFRKPHLAFDAPQKYWDLYPASDVTLAERSVPPQDAPDAALTNFNELRKFKNISNDKQPVPDVDALELKRGYLACVSYIDALVGKLLSEVDVLGLSDDTIIVVWGDHGFKLGEYGSWSKHTNFEIDTHIPLIIKAPGTTKAGSRSSALVETVDIFPTLTQLAGLPTPSKSEGLSFVPVLKHPERLWKSAAFSQFSRGRGGENEIRGYSLRTAQYRYTAWIRTEDGSILAQELYDHKVDTLETRNLAGDPTYTITLNNFEKMRVAGWRAALPQN